LYYHIKAAALALAETGHVRESAIDILRSGSPKRERLLAAAQQHVHAEVLSVETLASFKAHFEDFVQGKKYFNIQTAEVVSEHRSLPLSEEVTLHADFITVFGATVPACTVAQPEANRQVFHIKDSDGITQYEVAAWNSQSRDETSESLRRAGVLRGDHGLATTALTSSAASSFEDVDCGVLSIPICCDDSNTLLYNGNRFVPYTKGSCGWFSTLFDDIVLESATLHSLPSPKIWIWNDFIHAFSKSSLIDFRIFPWALILAESTVGLNKSEAHSAPVYDGNGDPARKLNMFRRFFEVMGNNEWKTIQCFALRERGRALQREIVYTSDARLCLADIPESSRPINKPFRPGREHEAGDFFSGMPVIHQKSQFNGAHSAFSEEWSDSGLQNSLTLVISRTRLEHQQTLVPSCALRGLIPEVLLENFTFWLSGLANSPSNDHTHITGQLHRHAISHFQKWGSDATIEILLDHSRHGFIDARVYRKRIIKSRTPTLASGKSQSDVDVVSSGSEDEDVQPMQSREILLNLPLCSRTSAMGRIINELAYVENLSHILVWGEEMADNSPKVNVTKVEAPRAGLFLRFQSEDNVSRMFAEGQSSLQQQVVRVSSEDDDTFLGNSHSSDDTLTQLLPNLPHAAVFCNSSQQRFLLIPVWHPRPLKICQCPFEGRALMRKSRLPNSQTFSLKFKLHTGGTFLQGTNDVFSSLYLSLMYFVHMDYLSATRILRSCVIDGELSKPIVQILRLFGQTQEAPSGDFHPNAVALRLRVALQCCDGHLNDCPWNIHEDHQEYLKKMTHVHPQCVLTREEETMLLKQLSRGSMQESRLMQLECANKYISVSVPNQKVGGVAWVDFIDKYVRSFLVDRSCGYPTSNFQSMHTPGSDVSEPDASRLLIEISKTAKGGNFASSGFYPLYEILARSIQLNAIGVTDAHSLASMMLQRVWLSATKQFQITLPREDNLCIFVLAMMSARGFNQHMERTEGHKGLLKHLPGYHSSRRSRNAELLSSTGIRARHPRSRHHRELDAKKNKTAVSGTFAERLEGAACAVMRNMRRSQMSQEDSFLVSPHDSNDELYTKPEFSNVKTGESSESVAYSAHEISKYGPAPAFWSDHLKKIGLGAPLRKENHTSRVICIFPQLFGPSDCLQNTLGFLAATPLTVKSYRTTLPVRICGFLGHSDNDKANSNDEKLDICALCNLGDVISNMPKLAHAKSSDSESLAIPILSCITNDHQFRNPDLVKKTLLTQPIKKIPFQPMFQLGVEKQFEERAREKITLDLQQNQEAMRFTLSCLDAFDAHERQMRSLKFDSKSDALFKEAVSKLCQLHASLEKHRLDTRAMVTKGVNAINHLLHSFDAQGSIDQVQKERLIRAAGLRPTFKFDDLVAICLSSNANEDLLSSNPNLTHEMCSLLIQATSSIMFLSVRLGHIIRCLNQTFYLIDDVVLYASQRIRAFSGENKLLMIRDMLISHSFSPLAVQKGLDQESAVLSPSDDVESARCGNAYVSDGTFSPTSDTPLSVPSPGRSADNAAAKTRTLSDLLKRHTSSGSHTRRNHHRLVNLQWNNICNASSTLAAMLEVKRDYSSLALIGIRSKVHPQDGVRKLDGFDPRFLVIEYV
jgi:hypothetical protein